MTAMPTRIETDLYDAAKSAGAVLSRSAAQQINHWARIGRELETAQGISISDITAVLAGRGSYDELGAREQAVVRAEWDERITQARSELNFETEFMAADEPWVEATPEGETVNRTAPSRRKRAVTKAADEVALPLPDHRHVR